MRKIVEVENKAFIVDTDEGYVQEVGTPIKYDPSRYHGYMEQRGRHISMLSYGMFGDDLHQASEAARVWCDKARRAWDAVCGE